LSCCKCDSSAPATTPSAARASPGRVTERMRTATHSRTLPPSLAVLAVSRPGGLSDRGPRASPGAHAGPCLRRGTSSRQQAHRCGRRDDHVLAGTTPRARGVTGPRGAGAPRRVRDGRRQAPGAAADGRAAWRCGVDRAPAELRPPGRPPGCGSCGPAAATTGYAPPSRAPVPGDGAVRDAPGAGRPQRHDADGRRGWHRHRHRVAAHVPGRRARARPQRAGGDRRDRPVAATAVPASRPDHRHRRQLHGRDRGARPVGGGRGRRDRGQQAQEGGRAEFRAGAQPSARVRAR